MAKGAAIQPLGRLTLAQLVQESRRLREQAHVLQQRARELKQELSRFPPPVRAVGHHSQRQT